MKNLSLSDMIVWCIVNMVCVAQAIGFVSRNSGPGVQSAMGILIMVLALPAGYAVVLDLDSGRSFRQWMGAVVFIVFCMVELLVDTILEMEFRSPRRPAILVPYLVLFFGSILLMGVRMYPVSKPLWGVTVVTSTLLLGGMIWAHTRGVG